MSNWTILGMIGLFVGLLGLFVTGVIGLRNLYRGWLKRWRARHQYYPASPSTEFKDKQL